MPFRLLDLLLLICLSQGFIFGFTVLFSSFFRAKANSYLAYAIILIAVIGIAEWLSGWNFDDQYYLVDLLGDDVPWILLFGVPLFFYFLHSVGHPLAENKRRYWLFFLFLLFLGLNLLINLDVDFGLLRIPAIERVMMIVYDAEFYLALLYNIGLSTWSYFIIRNSSVNEVNKKWLRRIWLFSAILILLWLLIVILPIGSDFGSSVPNYYIWSAVSFFIFWLMYQGLFQLQLAKDQTAIQQLLKKKESGIGPESTPSPLSPDSAHFQRLEALMQQEHLYRNPNLGRDLLAERLNISTGYLSQLTNQASGKNFTQYINDYRIADVKQMMLDPDFGNYSLLAIGMEAGFRSKSAFYTTFRKSTGMTPSEFKKKQEKVLIP